MGPTVVDGLPVGESTYVDVDELHARYALYRRRQAARLVRMLPKEAVRPLYRRARAEVARAEATRVGTRGLAADNDDPLALLMDYCERLLPLPSFDIWVADLAGNPHAHWADLEDSLEGPTADAPSTMGARSFRVGGRDWLARLRSFREAGLWRGYIAFDESATGRVHRTATVFCEHEAEGLLARFEAFDSSALEAFLRSALP